MKFGWIEGGFDQKHYAGDGLYIFTDTFISLLFAYSICLPFTYIYILYFYLHIYYSAYCTYGNV